MLKTLLPLVAGLVATGVLAQGVPMKRPDAPPLALRGPHSVGVRTLTLTDPTRSRTITLEVWYPSTSPDAPLTYSAVIGATPVEIAGQASRNAPAQPGPFPLVVASHGQPGTRFQFAYLSEHLASHGLVVANLDHPGSTYPELTQPNYITSIVDRPLDLLWALEELPRQLTQVDGSRVGLMGYSYGGYSVMNAAGGGLDLAALQAYCQQTGGDGPCFALPYFAPLEAARGRLQATGDPRIKAVLALAPYGAPWLGADSLAQFTTPLMVAAGDQDDVATYQRDAVAYFEQAGSAHKYLLTLAGARHNPFVECPPMVRVSPTDYDRCWEPVWDQERSHDVIMHFATAFFGQWLQGNQHHHLNANLEGFLPRARVGLSLRTGGVR